MPELPATQSNRVCREHAVLPCRPYLHRIRDYGDRYRGTSHGAIATQPTRTQHTAGLVSCGSSSGETSDGALFSITVYDCVGVLLPPVPSGLADFLVDARRFYSQRQLGTGDYAPSFAELLARQTIAETASQSLISIGVADGNFNGGTNSAVSSTVNYEPEVQPIQTGAAPSLLNTLPTPVAYSANLSIPLTPLPFGPVLEALGSYVPG